MRNVLAITLIVVWAATLVTLAVNMFSAARANDLLWFSLNALALVIATWWGARTWHEAQHRGRAREALQLLEEARDIQERRKGVSADG